MAAWKAKRETKDRYDTTARLYDRLYSEEQQAKYAAALLMTNNVPKGLVLDLGCGSGLFFSHLRGRVQGIVGVDISKNLLLRAKVVAASDSNIFLVLADADNLPFLNGTFTSVFSFTVLQNMPAPIDTLKEVGRVLEEKGMLVVSELKKIISLDEFQNVMKIAHFHILSVVDEGSLKCYVAIAGRT